MESFIIACASGENQKLHGLLKTSEGLTQEILDEGLASAAKAGHNTTCNVLLDNGAHIGQPALLAALHRPSNGILDSFVAHGWDVNSLEFGNPAIQFCASNVDSIRWLLDHGADPNLRGTFPRNSVHVGELRATALETAMHCESFASADLLLARGAVLDIELSARLFNACLTRRHQLSTAVLQHLLDIGADPDCYIQRHLSTPLQLACRRGMADMAGILLTAGANRSVKDKAGRTPLEEAQERGDDMIMDLFSKY